MNKTKKSNKRVGIIFVVIGAVLVLSALLLFVYNLYDDYRAGEEADVLLDDIKIAIAQKKEAEQSIVTEESVYIEESFEASEESEESAPLPEEMPLVEIDGYEYIGYITFPDFDRELPVMAEWDYKRLKKAPCRYIGSSRTDDLVIAAHNNKRHFGILSSLKTGSEVIFTDMDGIVNRYRLMKEPETFAPDAVDAVQNSGYDLVLYTCTPGGANRVVVFCDRVPEDE